MSTSKTLHTDYDDATRNQFIGAMHVTGKLTESANLVGMSMSAASCLWKKAQKTGKTKDRPHSGHLPKLNNHAKCAIVQDNLNHQWKPFQEIAHQAVDNISGSTISGPR